MTAWCGRFREFRLRTATRCRALRDRSAGDSFCAVVETMLKVAAGELDEAAVAAWLPPEARPSRRGLRRRPCY